MKKILPTLAFLSAAALSVSGCDFFRTLAGRPTSGEIEAKREVIRRQEAETKAPEATAVADTIQVAEAPVEEIKQEVKKRYYVVVASFSNPDNARKSLARMTERGYPGELLGFKGGYTGVGICGTDSEEEAKASLKELKRQDFCPQGVWIIDRNKR